MERFKATGADRMRIYFAKYRSVVENEPDTPDDEREYANKRTVVLVAANKKDIYEPGNDDLRPENIGTLCPPGTSCFENAKTDPVYLNEALRLIDEGKVEYFNKKKKRN